jgi:hypothetical protein
MDRLAGQIKEKLEEVEELYHRLIVVMLNRDTTGEMHFEGVARKMDLPLVNVNLELSKRLLELTKRQRMLQVDRLMKQIVAEVEGDTVLLENIELLFESSLRLNPLHLLQGLARNKTIVVAWPGSADDDYLTYAEHGHPEYKRYPVRDVVLVSG